MDRTLPLVCLFTLLYDKRAAIQHDVFQVDLPAVLTVKPNRFWAVLSAWEEAVL
jgi:hypothetical protein